MAENGDANSSDSVSTNEEYEVISCAAASVLQQPELKIANNGDIEQLRVDMDAAASTDLDRARAKTLSQVPEEIPENRESRSLSLPEPLNMPQSPKNQISGGCTFFDNITYLGCAKIDAPRSAVEVARSMNILKNEQTTDQAMKISISVPSDSEGSVILRDPENETEIAGFKIHQIIFCCRGRQDSPEASCFAFTCSHGRTAETAIFQCHVFDCHTAEHVSQVLLSYATAFSRVTNRSPQGKAFGSYETSVINTPTPRSKNPFGEQHHTFEVMLEVQEEDGRSNYSAVPWDKSFFKLRCDLDKKLVLTVQQVGQSEWLSIEKCFGLLICPGRNVKQSDMQLLEMVSMGSSDDSENSYVIRGSWDPTDPMYEVLNTETPKDTKVYLTIAVDLVIKGIQEPVRFCLETKAKIFSKNERFWYFSKKVMQERFHLTLKHNFGAMDVANANTVINVESDSQIERKRKSLTLNLTNAGARAAVQSIQTPCEPDSESDGDEPLLSGSGAVSKDCTKGELDGWGEVLAKWRQNLKVRPKQLNLLVRRGIPEALRGEVWQLLAKCHEDGKEMMETYRILITKESPCESTIMRDINRTFPAHEFFREAGGLGQDSLYKISKAYSVYDQEVGYCQGLSFLAAALLLHMPEEQAFCLQVKIMFQYHLRDLFKQGFEELHLKFYQLERLLEDQIPELYSHFVELGIEAHMYGSQWFLTLFTAKFPLCLVFYILDLFLLEGMDTVFQIALALLSMSKDDLLALDFEGVLKYFRVSLPKKYRSDENTRQLIHTATKIKVKKLRKYEKEYHIIKEQENLQQDPIERFEKENKRLIDANMRLEQENDDLAHELVTSKILLRNRLDAAEDHAEALARDLKSTTKVLTDTEEEKKRLEMESTHVKEVFHRELKHVEEENIRNKAIVMEYKQICHQLSERIEKEQKTSKEAIRNLKSIIDLCVSCSKRLKEDGNMDNSFIKKLNRDMSQEKVECESYRDVDKRIRELELELAQTKLALVEAECKNQDSTHQLNAALVEIQSTKHTWFQKTLTSFKEATKQKEQGNNNVVTD